MRLDTKMMCGTGLMITGLLVSAWVAHAGVRGGDELAQKTLQGRLPLILQVLETRSSTARSVRMLEAYILFGINEEASRKYRTDRAELMRVAEAEINALNAPRGGLALGEDSARLAKVGNEVTELDRAELQVEELNETHTPENVARAYSLLQDNVLAQERVLFQQVNEIANSQAAQAQAEAAGVGRANRRTLAFLWLGTILTALGGGLFKMMLARRIATGMDELMVRANAIAEGDLTGPPLKATSDDQLGTLAKSMNRMQDSLGGIIGTVVDTAGSLTGSAASMRTASDGIHRRIDQQSQQTQQAATAMQEMSASIAEVSRHTQNAAETARSAAQTARDGGKIVKQVLGSMHSIATAVSETSETVGLLGEDSKRISQIVTVIDEIARKTNLLALNAAIEAARAGDQGRGFAVVAGEVRRLAESTAQATGEIGTMIREIQERTRTAIASMNAGTGTVQEGVLTTTQAGEALEKIIGMAERVDRMITQIAIAASQQATAADQSSASLDSIHSLSHDNLMEMATTAAGIEGLRGTAVRLENQVDRFQVVQGKAA